MQIGDKRARAEVGITGEHNLIQSIARWKTCSCTGEDRKLGSCLFTLRQFAACHIFGKRKVPVQAGTNLTGTVVMESLLMFVEPLR